MGCLDGRVAIITGAGRGIGREHALLFAAEGAAVVVNDVGGGTDGDGASAGPAHDVVAEIEASGGRAVASLDDIASSDGAAALVATAVEAFGRLDVLVNNAGILRDRPIVTMSDDDWDVSLRVNLRGHFLPLRAPARHWREVTHAGGEVQGSVINTSSESGVFAERDPGELRRGQVGRGDAERGGQQGAGPLWRPIERHPPAGPGRPHREHGPGCRTRRPSTPGTPPTSRPSSPTWRRRLHDQRSGLPRQWRPRAAGRLLVARSRLAGSRPRSAGRRRRWRRPWCCRAARQHRAPHRPGPMIADTGERGT